MSTQNDSIIHDLSIVCRLCLRMGISHGQLAVLTSLWRGDCEAWEIQDRVAISKSNLYRQLRYLEKTGDIIQRTRKDPYRQTVKTWHLSAQGKKTIMRYEQVYRTYCERAKEKARMQSKETRTS